MSLTKRVATMLNATIKSVKTCIPFQVQVSKPSLTKQPYNQEGMSVIIGVTGEVRGRLIIAGEHKVIKEIGGKVFGMPLDDEIVPSFTGELGNMIGGNIAITLSEKDLDIDITPPTTMDGKSKMFGFDTAVKLTVEVEDIGHLTVILALEDKK